MKPAIIIGMLVIILVGCQPSNTQLTAKDLRKGTEGVVLTFLDGAPPNNIYENSEMNIFVEAHNRGAYDTLNGVLLINTEDEYVTLHREAKIDDRLAQLNEGSISLELKGKNLKDEPGPAGQFVTYEFGADVKEITLSKLQDSNIKAIACYDYRTIADESICTASNSNRFSVTKAACKPQDIILRDQGAPVAITKIEVSSDYKSGLQSQNIFTIHLKNKGKGRIFSYGNTHDVCSPNPSKDRRIWDVVQVYAELGGVELTCDHNGLFRLSEEKESIICKGMLDDAALAPKTQLKPTNPEYFKPAEQLDTNRIIPKGSYFAPIYIEVEYGYLETISKMVKIERNI